MSTLPANLYHRAQRLFDAHPYVMGTGAALALTVGLGYGGAYFGYGGKWGRTVRNRRKFGTKGVIEDGMLKEAIGELASSNWYSKLTPSHSLPIAHAAHTLGLDRYPS